MLIFVDSKALKWAHSWLRNYFSTAAYRKNQPIENRIRGSVKYKYSGKSLAQALFF
jgi:hypothetical protein